MKTTLENLLVQISEYLEYNEKFNKSIATRKIDSLGNRVFYQLNNRIAVTLKAIHVLWMDNLQNSANKYSTGLLLRTICTDIITYKYLALKEDENLLENELKLFHLEYLKTTTSFIDGTVSLFSDIGIDNALVEMENEKQVIIENDTEFFKENGKLKKVQELGGPADRGYMISENYKIKYIKNRNPDIIRFQFPLSRSLYYFNKYHHYSLASQELAKDDEKYYDYFHWIIFESVMILHMTTLLFYDGSHPLVEIISKLKTDLKPEFLKS